MLKGRIIHFGLTQHGVLVDVAPDHRHRGVQSQRFLDHHLQVLEFAQDLHIHRRGLVIANHVPNLLEDASLSLRIAGEQIAGEGYAARGGVMALEHEGVHFLANVLVRQRCPIDGGLQQDIQQGHAAFLAHVIQQGLVLALGDGLLEKIPAFCDHLVGEIVHGLDGIVQFGE